MAGSMTPDVIADRISLAIREKVLAPGQTLVQEDLARRFKVSRSPIREALRILATEGVVIMSPGGTASVRELGTAELEELYDLRIMIEPTIAPLIVERSTAADEAALRSLAERMSETEETSAWMRLNFEFHERLFAMAGRPYTQGILRGLLTSVQPYSQENIERLGGRVQADLEHHEMIESIRAGDVAQLAELMRVHLRSARDRVSQAHAAAELEESDPLAPLR